jgi:hypothetical protein
VAAPPTPEMVDTYRSAQARYRQLYPALKAAGTFA